MSNANPKLLKESIDEAMKKFPAKLDENGKVVETYCNMGLQYVAKAMGYLGFHNLTANQISEKLPQDWAFAPVDGETAQRMANHGSLTVGAWANKAGHGHVACVYPTDNPMLVSGKWGSKKVPWIGNVGPKNEVMGANFAFGQEPKWYVYVHDPDAGV